MLRVQPQMQAERALHLPLGSSRQVCRGYLDEVSLHIVVASKQRHVLVHGNAGAAGLGIGAEACERGNGSIRAAGAHI